MNGKERAQGSRCLRVQLVFADEALTRTRTWQATLPEHDCMWANETSGSSRELAMASNRMLFPAPPFFASQLVNCKGSTTGHSQPVATLNTRSLAYDPWRWIYQCACVPLYASFCPPVNQQSVPHHKRHAAHVRPGQKTTSSNDLPVAHSPRPIEPGTSQTARQVPASHWSKHLPSCPKGHLVLPRRPREFQADIPSCRDAGRGSTPSEHERKKKKKRGAPFVWSTAVYIGSTMSDGAMFVLYGEIVTFAAFFVPVPGFRLASSLPLFQTLCAGRCLCSRSFFDKTTFWDFYSRTHSLA